MGSCVYFKGEAIMGKDRNSIFELERRIPFTQDFIYFLVDLKSSKLHSVSYLSYKSIIPLLDDVITEWPWRKGSINIEHFAQKFGFYQEAIFEPIFHDHPIPDEAEYDDQLSLYLLELIINLLFWIPNYLEQIGVIAPGDNITKGRVLAELKYFFDNIKDLLDGMNLQLKTITEDEANRYILVKRDADVDSVLEIVPELADSLLSYNDFRNRKNLKAKKAILIELAGYLEPIRKTFVDTPYYELADTCFFAFNNLNIRHNNAKQIPLSDGEQLEIYDKVFLMTLQLIRVSKVKDYKSDILVWLKEDKSNEDLKAKQAEYYKSDEYKKLLKSKKQSAKELKAKQQKYLEEHS